MEKVEHLGKELVRRMKIIDLFCGIGGAAIGIKKAFPEAEIIGYDIRDYSEQYPFNFIQKDITKFKEPPQADLYWASPPCQSYSVSTEKQRRYEGKSYPDLIKFTRDLLSKTNKPFIIENVIGSPLIKEKTVILRGHYFEGLRDMRRPRKFETHRFKAKKPKKLVKIFPYYRLISGGGGWIREGEPIIRMSVEEANSRFNVNGKNMWEVAQIVPYHYSKYICEQYKENIIET